jgi:hypothetical protein
MQMLDADHDDKLTREECVQGFSKWFDSWDPGKTGSITTTNSATASTRRSCRPVVVPGPSGRPVGRCPWRPSAVAGRPGADALNSMS